MDVTQLANQRAVHRLLPVRVTLHIVLVSVPTQNLLAAIPAVLLRLAVLQQPVAQLLLVVLQKRVVLNPLAVHHNHAATTTVATTVAVIPAAKRAAC